MSDPGAIPWRELEAIFLDAGNTLVSVDFPRVARELATLGIRADEAQVERAEAAARPALSARVAERARTEGEDMFLRYLRGILDHLPATRDAALPERERFAAEAAPRLREPGAAFNLWCRVMPGVPEALEALGRTGLPLYVVSNADGTAEHGLERVGLRRHFQAVFDSQLEGYEKPDPRLFEVALARAGSDPARTLHVGDIYHADVTGARAAGIHPLLLDPFDDWDVVDCEKAPHIEALAPRLAAARR